MRYAIVYRKAPNTFGANTLKLDYDTPTCGEWHRRSLKILRVLGYFLGIAARGIVSDLLAIPLAHKAAKRRPAHVFGSRGLAAQKPQSPLKL